MIFVVKYRKPLLDNGLEDGMKQIMFDMNAEEMITKLGN